MLLPSKKHWSLYKGKLAELWVCVALILQGHRIIARNWRSHLAEIDIITLKDGYISACEVKFRSNAHNINHAVSASQHQRIIRALILFASHHNQTKVNHALLVAYVFKTGRIIFKRWDN